MRLFPGSRIGSEYPDREQRQIVVLVGTVRKIIDFSQQLVDKCRGFQVSIAKQKIEYPLFAVFDTLRKRGMCLRQSVSVEQEQVATLKVNRLALELLLVKDAHQQTTRLQRTPFAIGADQERWVMTSVTVLERPRLGIEYTINEGQQKLAAKITVDSQICVAQCARGAMRPPRDRKILRAAAIPIAARSPFPATSPIIMTIRLSESVT